MPFLTPCRRGIAAGFVAALSLLTGCTSTYRFTVDAVRNRTPDEIAVSFRLVNATPRPHANDPAFLTIAEHVRTALSAKGLYEAPVGTTPDMYVEIDYSIDDFGHQVSTPDWRSADGYDFGPVYVTVYEKFLRVTARPARRGAPELWSVYVTNEDRGKDRDTYLLLLVSAAMDALGENLSNPHEVVLSNHDPRVEFVAQGM